MFFNSLELDKNTAINSAKFAFSSGVMSFIASYDGVLHSWSIDISRNYGNASINDAAGNGLSIY